MANDNRVVVGGQPSVNISQASEPDDQAANSPPPPPKRFKFAARRQQPSFDIQPDTAGVAVPLPTVEVELNLST